MPESRFNWWVILVAAALIAVVGWFVFVKPSGDERPQEAGAPADCPQHQIAIDTGGGIVDDIPLASEIDDVPEFHDCQRFLANTNSGYGQLVAVWAANGLATAFTDSAVQVSGGSGGGGATGAATAVSGAIPGAGEVRAAPTVTLAQGLSIAESPWVPVVQVYNFDATTYGPLGIQPGFSCLYLRTVPASPATPAGWAARMVPLKKSPTPCRERRRADDREVMVGVPLRVQVVPGVTGADVPPVARWDRDPKGHQYVGVRCDTVWCEVGNAVGFNVSPKLDGAVRSAYLAAYADAPDGIVATPAEKERVIASKGWYDQQVLATRGTPVRRSAIVGTIIPHPALDRYQESDKAFDGRWVPAAYIHVTGDYTGKVKLEEGMNVVSLCRHVAGGPSTGPGACTGVPTATACKSTPDGHQWWATFNRPKTGAEVICASFDETQQVIPAGAARWRWSEADEGTWVRCAEGCCSNN